MKAIEAYLKTRKTIARPPKRKESKKIYKRKGRKKEGKYES